MKKPKKTTIDIQGTEVAILSNEAGDYLSLTDMIRAKDGEFFISDWLRNRNTIEFLGIWESVFNPGFNYGEFATIKSQTGIVYATEGDLLNVALFGLTAAVWRQANPGEAGNMRDAATLEQLVVLSNLESINAVLIHQGLPAGDRLVQLNSIAITQMRSLVGLPALKRLGSTP